MLAWLNKSFFFHRFDLQISKLAKISMPLSRGNRLLPSTGPHLLRRFGTNKLREYRSLKWIVTSNFTSKHENHITIECFWTDRYDSSWPIDEYAQLVWAQTRTVGCAVATFKVKRSSREIKCIPNEFKNIALFFRTRCRTSSSSSATTAQESWRAVRFTKLVKLPPTVTWTWTTMACAACDPVLNSNDRAFNE